MKLLWAAVAAVLLAGCAVVPYPYPAPEPSVSVGVGVPVYRPYYYYDDHYRRPYYRGHGRPHYRRW